MKKLDPWRWKAVSVLCLIMVLSTPSMVRTQPPIFHPLEGRVGRCLTCHQVGALGAPKIPPDHAEYTNQTCLGCHARPGGNFKPLYGSFIPFGFAFVLGLVFMFKRFGIKNLMEDLLRREDTK